MASGCHAEQPGMTADQQAHEYVQRSDLMGSSLLQVDNHTFDVVDCTQVVDLQQRIASSEDILPTSM